MSTSAVSSKVEVFNARVVELLQGLLSDAQSDIAYDYVLPFHAQLEWCQRERFPDFLLLKFIGAVREHQPASIVCIRNRETKALFALATKVFPDDLAAPLKECQLSLDVPDLFREDTSKKLWKRIKKLVYASGLGALVYELEEDDTTTTVNPVASGASKHTEISQIKQARINRFNHGYRSFLEQMSIAFPRFIGDTDQVDTSVMKRFDEAIALNQQSAIEVFKTIILPVVPKIVAQVQGGAVKGGVQTVLEPYFGADPAWLKTLPYMSELAIDDYWQEQIVGNVENRTITMKAIGELAMVMTGIDTLVYSPIVAALKTKAAEIMKREKMNLESITPGGGTFNKSSAFNLVLELIQELPAATNYQITSSDMETLITNMMAQRDEVPKSFSDVFSPEMIDFDCIGALSEMEGVGALLAPYMASMQSQVDGHTGTPAFASVQKPAWM
jgi:hypothetical protein